MFSTSREAIYVSSTSREEPYTGSVRVEESYVYSAGNRELYLLCVQDENGLVVLKSTQPFITQTEDTGG